VIARIGRRSVLGGAAALLLLSRRGRADSPTLDDVLTKVAAARENLRTLVGPFTQTRRIGLLATEVRSVGTMTLVRPDRLRWDLGPPDDASYWVTPQGLAYKSRSGQGAVPGAAAARVAATLDDLRNVLGGDLGALRARYDLRLAPTGDGVAFEATPLESSGLHIQRITFALAGDLVRPLRATIVETARDRVDIVFGDLHRDAHVPASVMTPPS
jgi:outer membrane lipoprotein-sorting protein